METRIEKSGYWYYPQHFEDGKWRYCVDRDKRGVGTMRFLTEELAQFYLDNDYAGAMARRMAFVEMKASEDVQELLSRDVTIDGQEHHLVGNSQAELDEAEQTLRTGLAAGKVQFTKRSIKIDF